MKTLIPLFLFASAACSQTCQYQTLSYPSGAVQVFRNGALQRQNVDFTYAKPAGVNPLISPLLYSAGDQYTVIFPRKLSLSTTAAGVPVPYVSYQDVMEHWVCSSGNTGPAPWIPPTCYFSDPPAAPVMGQTCIFLDADLFRSCQGAAPGSPVGQETCRWTGDHWQTTAVPVESPLFPFGSYSARAIECQPGKVDFSQINPATSSLEVPLFSVDGSARWDHVMVSETEGFSPGLGLTVSMGRPRTTNDEMTGAAVGLGRLALASWTARPIPPQTSGSYTVALSFNVAAGHLLQELTAGSLYWEVCGYRVGPVIASPARLAGLTECSGSGTVIDPATGAATGWNCAGIFKASIILQDGSPLSLVGVRETGPAGGVWTAR